MRQELLSPGVTARAKQMKSHISIGRCGKTKPEQKKKRRKLSSLPLKWVRESISDNTNHNGTYRQEKNSVAGNGQGYSGVEKASGEQF